MPFSVITVFEIIGTVAFAASGAIVALKKEMDIFGVAILGLFTAVGGGVIRDMILGNTPPAVFKDPVYALVAIITSIIIFLPSVRGLLKKSPKVYDIVMLIMDSVGLGIFTVVGIQTAKSVNPESGYFLLVFVGIVTGVGGGLLRDICAGVTPYIFIKHFYACASLLGSLLCALLWNYTSENIAMISGSAAVLVLRILAAKFRWSLPKARL